MIKSGAAIVAALCALFFVAAVDPAAADDKKAVGAYLFKFTGGLPPDTYVPGLATLHSDGTVSSVTGSDESGPLGVFVVKNSAVHGVWSAHGSRGVRATALFLNFDPLGGQVVSITKLRIVAEFEKGFDTGSGVFFDSIYVCPTFITCPDPLTTAPMIPEPAAGRPFSVHRIQ